MAGRNRREIVFINKNGLTLIDFDDCGYGFPLYDLATATIQSLEEKSYQILNMTSKVEKKLDMKKHFLQKKCINNRRKVVELHFLNNFFRVFSKNCKIYRSRYIYWWVQSEYFYCRTHCRHGGVGEYHRLAFVTTRSTRSHKAKGLLRN